MYTSVSVYMEIKGVYMHNLIFINLGYNIYELYIFYIYNYLVDFTSETFMNPSLIISLVIRSMPFPNYLIDSKYNSVVKSYFSFFLHLLIYWV